MEIEFEEIPFDLDFHPSAPIVAAGLITGDLHLYRYGSESSPARLHEIQAHDGESCRAVRFIDSGRVILTASADHSILATDVQTGKSVARLENAHDNGIYRIVCLTDSMVASGDDEGVIKVWDTRQNACCNTFQRHEDYISDMMYITSEMQILATSGDGTLTRNSLRKNKVLSQTEFAEDELLSLVRVKEGKKIVCGTQTGALLLYSWGHMKDCSDRFLGLPSSVDTLLKYDEDSIISGSSDGVIRLVGILPNKIIQPLAEHSNYPIERLAFSGDGKFLGSISHDRKLKMWEMQELLDGNHVVQNDEILEDSSDNDMDLDADLPSPPNESKRKKPRQSKNAAVDFFADL